MLVEWPPIDAAGIRVQCATKRDLSAQSQQQQQLASIQPTHKHTSSTCCSSSGSSSGSNNERRSTKPAKKENLYFLARLKKQRREFHFCLPNSETTKSVLDPTRCFKLSKLVCVSQSAIALNQFQQQQLNLSSIIT